MSEAEPVDPPFKTYSLDEVAAMVMPPEQDESAAWLARQLRAGRISGYKIRRTWRMTHQDVEDLIASGRKRPPVGRAPDPSGMTRTSRRRLEGYAPRSKAQTDCQTPE